MKAPDKYPEGFVMAATRGLKSQPDMKIILEGLNFYVGELCEAFNNAHDIEGHLILAATIKFSEALTEHFPFMRIAAEALSQSAEGTTIVMPSIRKKE